MKILSVFLLTVLVSPLKAQAPTQSSRDSKELLPAVAQAIEDELYDLKHEKLYFQIDENSGGDTSPAEISIYVSKEVSPNGTGVVVYKDMPYGEVYRYFDVEPDGTIKLAGDPTSKFPPYGGSMLTVYMTDEEVFDFIEHKAYKFKFTIDPQASPKRIHDAEERQLRRTGYSFRLHKGPGYKVNP
jgi:hypothetical protein